MILLACFVNFGIKIHSRVLYFPFIYRELAQVPPPELCLVGADFLSGTQYEICGGCAGFWRPRQPVARDFISNYLGACGLFGLCLAFGSGGEQGISQISNRIQHLVIAAKTGVGKALIDDVIH